MTSVPARPRSTLATADSGEPIFTPNGDGISDSIAISHRLSENAFIEMQVKRDGKVVRQSTTWALKGRGSLSWDGRRDDGKLVGEGSFKIVLTPTDRAGNRGEPAEARVRGPQLDEEPQGQSRPVLLRRWRRAGADDRA